MRIMDQTTVNNVATNVVATSKSLIARQIDQQAHALGGRVSQTARDLDSVGKQLRASDTISSAASVAEWAAQYVRGIGEYLTSGDTDRFISDVETFGRERPLAVAASAAALGFAAARVVKSSSARRFYYPQYGGRYEGGDSYDRASGSDISRPGQMP